MNTNQAGGGSLAAALAAVLALGAAPSANAGTVAVANGGNLSLTVANTGTSSGGTGSTSAITNPGNYYYNDSFTSKQTTTFKSTGDGFYDDFVFTIGAGQVDSITSSITLGSALGISGLQARLYDYTANGGVAPLLTPPTPGSAFDAWSSTAAFSGGSFTASVLPATTLTAGTYVIEIRGTSTGTFGGNYTGTLNVTPVPLPAGLPALLGGFGLLAGYTRRRTLA
jgi:hypothetical protein